MRYILTLLLTLAMAGPAFAFSTNLIDSRTNPTDTTLTGIVTPATSIRAMDNTNNAVQNRSVILQGRLTKSGMTGTNYILEDNTGNVMVQIDDHIMDGYRFENNNIVRVRGNIVRGTGGQIRVNADTIELLR